MSNENKQTNSPLQRTIGFWRAVGIMGGIIIGSGIFYIPAYALDYAYGNAGLALVGWILAGLMCLGASMCYAEFGSMIPKAGGTYLYISEAYGKAGPLIAYTMGWADTLVMIPAGNTALALVAAQYIGSLFGGFTAFQTSCVAAGLIFMFTMLNIRGAKEGGTISTVLLAVKVSAIIAVILACFFFGGGGGDAITFQYTLGEGNPVSAIVFSVVAALWCFDGWNSICHMAGEIKDPGKNISKVMLFTLTAVTVIYLLYNIAIMKIVPIADIVASENVTFDVVQLIFGKGAAVVITCCIIASVLGGLSGSILVYPREIYAIARDHRFFAIFGKLDKKNKQPVNAHLYVMALGILYCFMASVQYLVNLSTLCGWTYYMLVVLGVIVMRKRRPDMERPYKVWGYPIVPILVACCAVVMIIANYYWDQSLIFGFVLPLTGIPAYFAFNAYYKKHGYPEFEDELKE